MGIDVALIVWDSSEHTSSNLYTALRFQPHHTAEHLCGTMWTEKKTPRLLIIKPPSP
jgi:hypothetical protein